VWITFHDNGQKASQGNYKGDVKVGKWQYWSVEGELKNEELHSLTE
jgi:antitoxin component YwqK of YwqJK toxin-antitoxin module